MALQPKRKGQCINCTIQKNSFWKKYQLFWRLSLAAITCLCSWSRKSTTASKSHQFYCQYRQIYFRQICLLTKHNTYTFNVTELLSDYCGMDFMMQPENQMEIGYSAIGSYLHYFQEYWPSQLCQGGHYGSHARQKGGSGSAFLDSVSILPRPFQQSRPLCLIFGR